MNKKLIRLTEQDLHRIVKESVNKVLKESSPDYAEVRSNYHDDDRGATTIDTWETMDDNEEGKVVAYVYDNGKVEWVNPNAQFSPMVKSEIDQVLNRLR